MRIRTLIYYITSGFVAGIIMLVAVQYITNSNVKELINGNENLLNEYDINNGLVGLQKDLLQLDNTIKTAITAGDSGKINESRQDLDKLKEDVTYLKKTGSHSPASKYMAQLDVLVHQKIDFSHQLIDSFYIGGKPAAERLLYTSQTLKLSEAITDLAHKIDTSGRISLAQKILTVDRSGRRVQTWNFYIIVSVLVLLTAVFLIIVNRMKKQAELITQLNTSEKKLKEAALIKENFLANMSHEIRTPLNAILGYSNLLQKKELDEDTRMHLNTVRQSGETLLTLVNDILDLSKIESGMMRIEEAPFSLHNLVLSVNAMFDQKISEKGLRYETSLSPEIPDLLTGDATRLTQILVNLIGNAVKFTASGSIKLEISGQFSHAESMLVTFCIADTGIGIAEDKIETIFERFRQAEDATTRTYGGTGLGLSIVRDLVHLQKGKIQVQSQPGLGTSVYFSTPYKIAPGQKEISPARNGDVSAFLPGLKVLVVEDNRINLGLITRILQHWEVKVTEAESGLKAIELLKKNSVDLILMDIQMPEMDGYTATQEIRETIRLNIPIIAMTAHAMPGDREKSLAHGMTDHITKPVQEKVLLDALLRAVTHASEGKQYKTIDLHYMREISRGDVEYEKLVTEQFLELIPQETEALFRAFENGNLSELKKIAHKIKSSISVMGLEHYLDEHLTTLEMAQSNQDVAKEVAHILTVCKEGMEEARHFYLSFDTNRH